VIALFKDVPDSKGDRAANVRTLTVRMGVDRVFWACIWILTAAYAGAIIYSVLAAHFAASAGAASMHMASAAAMPASLSLLGGDGGTLGLRTLACVAGHATLAGLLWQRALRTDLSSTDDISACYMHTWKLFYAEYILIPLLL
jgi:homogentisate phytyltransferase/homogentisate geranylgeranyltransferase